MKRILCVMIMVSILFFCVAYPPAVAAKSVLKGSFSATGTSDTVKIHGPFNFALKGGATATVELQRCFSFDDNCGVEDNWGAVQSYTSNTEDRGEEEEQGVLYRAKCTAYTTGTFRYRISQ